MAPVAGESLNRPDESKLSSVRFSFPPSVWLRQPCVQLRWYARALREITGLPVRFGGLYSLRRRTLVPVEV